MWLLQRNERQPVTGQSEASTCTINVFSCKKQTLTNKKDRHCEGGLFGSTDVYFNKQINRGYANRVGEYVYSSSFDEGEGWSTADIIPSNPYQLRFLQLNLYTAGPPNSFSVRVNAAGNAENTRNLRINLNTSTGTEIYNVGMPFFTYKKELPFGESIHLCKVPV